MNTLLYTAHYILSANERGQTVFFFFTLFLSSIHLDGYKTIFLSFFTRSLHYLHSSFCMNGINNLPWLFGKQTTSTRWLCKKRTCNILYASHFSEVQSVGKSGEIIKQYSFVDFLVTGGGGGDSAGDSSGGGDVHHSVYIFVPLGLYGRWLKTSNDGANFVG